jgi:DNA-binding response OmpR family regulator
MADSIDCDVLIVEDDMIQSQEMAGYLSRTGLSVQTAHSGSAAMRQAGFYNPRVALLDFNLPDTTGVELAKRLRALFPDLAIIMMSGRIDGLSEQTLRSIGITVFVNKPLPLGALRQAVLRLVRSSESGAGGPAKPTGWLAAGYGGTRH